MRRAFLASLVLSIMSTNSSSSAPAVNLPAGTLRATFIATNPVQGIVDKSGAVRGPAADLTAALGKQLGVQAKVTPSNGVQEVLQAVKNGEADIGFLAFDPGRAAEVDYSQIYSLAQNTYMVLENSPLKSVNEV